MYFPDEKDPFIVCDHFLFVWKSFDPEEDFSCVRWRPWSLFIGLGPSCRGKKRGGLVRGNSDGGKDLLCLLRIILYLLLEA